MRLFDRVLNAAADATRATAAEYDRTRRREALLARIAEQHAIARGHLGRLGRLAIVDGTVPPVAADAATAIRAWEHELGLLLREAATLEPYPPGYPAAGPG